MNLANSTYGIYKASELSKYLKKCREDRGLSQAIVSQRLGYSTSQFISNWERGVSHPPMSKIKTLSELYQVSSDTLFEHLLKDAVRMTTDSMKSNYLHAMGRV